jgi:hypothetical protein
MQPNDWISFTKKLLFFMTSMALGEIFADQAPKSCIMQKKKKKKKKLALNPPPRGKNLAVA